METPTRFFFAFAFIFLFLLTFAVYEIYQPRLTTFISSMEDQCHKWGGQVTTSSDGFWVCGVQLENYPVPENAKITN